MFIWLVAPCGISLLPAVDEGFLLTLQHAPPLDLYTVHAKIFKDVIITHQTLNKSFFIWYLYFPNLLFAVRKQGKGLEGAGELKKTQWAIWLYVKQAQTQTLIRSCLSVDAHRRECAVGAWSTQVTVNQRPIDTSTRTQVSLHKHKSCWLVCWAAESRLLLHQALTG